MRKLTKVLISSLLAAPMALAIGLNFVPNEKETEVRALEPITGITISAEGVVTWDPFPGAYDYMWGVHNAGGFLGHGVDELDLEYECKRYHVPTNDSVNWYIYALDESKNQISAKYSSTYSFTNTQTPLDAPTNLRWENTTMKWDGNPDADYHEIQIYSGNSVGTGSWLATYDLYYGICEKNYTGFTLGQDYWFKVIARASYDDLDHNHSDAAFSELHQFTPTVNLAEVLEVKDNGNVHVDINGIERATYQIIDASEETPYGAVENVSLPFNLYDKCAEKSVPNGTEVKVAINIYDENNLPLSYEYVYTGFTYNTAEAPDAMSGSVTIDGTIKYKSTLTANVSSLTHSGVLSYQWKRVGKGLIEGATNSTYTLAPEDIGESIFVTVESSDNKGVMNSNYSSPIAKADVTGSIEITGTLKFGETLSCDLSGTNIEGDISYQWKRDGSGSIDGATSSSYVLIEDDIGESLYVTVSSNLFVQTSSGTTDIVEKADGPAAPTGFVVLPSLEGENDGSISGISNSMEYRPQGGDWTDGTGEAITGLAAGNYEVRIKQTPTTNYSATTNLVVGVGHTITVTKGTANVSRAVTGETVTITASEPEAGYEFDKWVGEGVTFANANNSETSFVMIDSNVEITATYKEAPAPINPELTKGLSGGAIAGIVVGSVVVVGLCGFSVVWFVIKKKSFADLVAIFKKK